MRIEATRPRKSPVWVQNMDGTIVRCGCGRYERCKGMGRHTRCGAGAGGAEQVR